MAFLESKFPRVIRLCLYSRAGLFAFHAVRTHVACLECSSQSFDFNGEADFSSTSATCVLGSKQSITTNQSPPFSQVGLTCILKYTNRRRSNHVFLSLGLYARSTTDDVGRNTRVLNGKELPTHPPDARTFTIESASNHKYHYTDHLPILLHNSTPGETSTHSLGDHPGSTPTANPIQHVPATAAKEALSFPSRDRHARPPLDNILYRSQRADAAESLDRLRSSQHADRHVGRRTLCRGSVKVLEVDYCATRQY